MTASPWGALEPGHIGFCEARLDAWIVEPANAWSSAAYVAVGLYLATRAYRSGKLPLLLVGVTAVLVGLGSFAFHATGTFLGEFADEASMFLIGSLMMTLALRRAYGWSLGRCAQAFALFATTASLLLARFHGTGLVAFALQIGVTAALEIGLWRRSLTESRARANYRGLKLTLATFGAAYAVWWLDFGKVICDPANHVFGAHAAWHSLSALSLVFYQSFQAQFIGEGPAVPARAPVPALAPSAPLAAGKPDSASSFADSIRSIQVMRAPMLSAPESTTLR